MGKGTVLFNSEHSNFAVHHRFQCEDGMATKLNPSITDTFILEKGGGGFLKLRK